MGKQIRFFMLESDEKKFLEYITLKGGIIIDFKGKPEMINEIYKINTRQFLISFANSNLIPNTNGILKMGYSEVIEFTRSNNKNTKELRNGRIWYETQYYNDKGELARTPDWLDKIFNEYKKWIIKNCRLSKNKGFYIGEEAYELYKEQGYKMMNSPKTAIEFD